MAISANRRVDRENDIMNDRMLRTIAAQTNGAFCTRREMLVRSGMGLGMLGLASLFREAQASTAQFENPLSPKAPHFPAKAKHIIHVFLNGGPSHVDTFDPKPILAKYAGKTLPERKSAYRAEDRRGVSVAVQVPEVRPERHRDQRAFSPPLGSMLDDFASSARCTPTCRTTNRR